MKTKAIAYDSSWVRRLWLMLLVATAALVLAGCFGSGAIKYGDPDVNGGGGGGGPSSAVTASYAATGTIGVFTRSILVSFSRELTADERQYVEENFSVTDEEKNPFPVVDAYWLSGSLFRICGPLEYGATYDVDIGDLPVSASVGKATELSGSVTLDVNPFDFDGGVGLSADLPFIFQGVMADYLVILLGEQISLLPSSVIPTETLINFNLVWNFSTRARIRAPMMMRNWDGSGMPSVNEWADGTFLIWNRYDMSDTSFHSSIDPPVLPSCKIDLLAGVGDLDADGIDDAMYGVECKTGGSDRYYGVAIIRGAIPSELNMALGALMVASGSIGSATPTSTHHYADPMTTPADLDGDGFFDIAGVWRDAGFDSDGYFIVESSEAQIFFGSEDLSSMLAAPGATIAMTKPNRDLTGAYAADVNGDGVSDLILTSVYRPLNAPDGKLEPEVHVFLGGDHMRGSMTDADASFVIRQTQSLEASVTVTVIGDENADGREDIFLNYTYSPGVKLMYLMHGRKIYKAEYVIESDYDKYIVPGDNYDQPGLSFPARTGDIDNDGYDDFMLKANADDLGDRPVILVIMGGGAGEHIMLEEDVYTRILLEP
ncbi:MAG: hypothetical protein JXA24_00995 [Proteobacteria bacterium]|nr:hypothetical protein [Pseudomonadota bacterium]